MRKLQKTKKPAERDLEEGGETDESRKKQRRPT